MTTILISQNGNFFIDNSFPYYVNAQTLGRSPIGGDTIFISSYRTKSLKFQFINGNPTNPVVVINNNGQVKINDLQSWGAIVFENSKYIKISGAGHPNYKYGFELSASMCGLAFAELSSDCEAEFIKISHEGFFGISAKKDYDGNPPIPIPVFENLVIHDCFIENVSEGMYLGETKSPGMEFKHVKIYNNIVRNTKRESIQIANMVEDIEIYNNTLLNAGLDGDIYHTNILQIGDNSVVNAYNNILSTAAAYGIINFGMGHCTFTNNYIDSTLGIFCDNRSFSTMSAPVNIKENYILSTTGSEIIKNMNEINYLYIQDNAYDSDLLFFLNQSGNTSNFTTSNNTLTTIAKIEFKDPTNNDYALAEGTANEYLNMGAPGGPEYFDEIAVPARLLITSEMVVDSVQGGSYHSPLYLFDEQNIDHATGAHATSNSWKPHWNMDKAPYHVIVDLGQEHQITEINLHDMQATNNFTVEYGSASNWSTLFIEPCDGYNVWKIHITDVSTRYLRLSMYDDVYAAVNEIIIYGHPTETASISSKSTSKDAAKQSKNAPLIKEENIKLFINSLDQTLHLKFPNHMLGNNYMKIINFKGRTLLDKNISLNTAETILGPSDFQSKLHSGHCVLFCRHASGAIKAVRFYIE